MADATFNDLARTLQDWGLGQLFSYNGGQPGGWLWQQLQTGVDTFDEFVGALENTDVYRQRFAPIFAQRQQVAQGKPVQVMTPSEVVAYENNARQLFQRWGLPGHLWDQYQDFAPLMEKGISPDELNARIEDGYARVLQAPPDVRSFFEDYYGVGRGDAMLAAFFLDPNKVMTDVTRSVGAASLGAMAQRYGIQVGRPVAERLVDLNITDAKMQQGLVDAGQFDPLYKETVGESTTGPDLTKGGTGVAATLGVDLNTGTPVDQAAAQRQLQQRLSQRKADFATTGEAIAGRQGLAGAGAAE